MNEASHIVAGSMPKLSSVRAAEGLSIDVTWEEGFRKGRSERIDLSPLVKCFKLYRALRKNRALFESVHLIEDGEVIAWGDNHDIDMAADSIERLANEALDAAEFRELLSQQGLTQEAAAALLGYSRRQIAHYLAGDKPIPRVFALACRAVEARGAKHETPSAAWCGIVASIPWQPYRIDQAATVHHDIEAANILVPPIWLHGTVESVDLSFDVYDVHHDSNEPQPPAMVLYDAA
jgi:Helix-turn-helix domain